VSPFALRYPTLLDALAARIREAPGDDAMRYRDRTISFGALGSLTDRFAGALTARGIQRGDRVAVCLQNVPEYPIALVGIWKAGAIAVSVSPLLRTGEIDKLLADCGATAFITDPLDVDTAAPGAVPANTFAAGDTAVITYTSGTTGPAKGAQNTHGGISAGGQIYQALAGIDERDRIACLAPLFHVTGLTGYIALSLVSGAALVLDHRFEAASALALIERHRCTFTVAAITALRALQAHPDAAVRDVSSLTKVWSGGQSIPLVAAESFEAWCGVMPRNAYGLTETTYPCLAIAADERPAVDPATNTLALGRPTTGTDVRIVDDAGTPLAEGAVGEIVVRGPGVMSGYWQRATETADAYFPDGWLRTGDVGYRDEAGWFYLLDRKKDQINSSGFKIWQREVEDVLYLHPAVREAAVVGLPDDERGEIVTAFVSLVPGATASPSELIAFARERVAAYKYPRKVVIMSELPKNANGKFLRRVLRE
jgi:long-chain acyl-CoA synthetase